MPVQPSVSNLGTRLVVSAPGAAVRSQYLMVAICRGFWVDPLSSVMKSTTREPVSVGALTLARCTGRPFDALPQSSVARPSLDRRHRVRYAFHFCARALAFSPRQAWRSEISLYGTI